MSITATEEQWRSSIRLTTERDHLGLGEWLDLSAFAVTDLRLLCAYQGYLFIGTQGTGLIVTNAISPTTAVQLLAGEDVMGLSLATTESGPRVLVTTREVVYQLDLLPKLQERVLYRTHGGFVTSVLTTAEGAIVFERGAEGVTVRLLQGNTGAVIHSDSLPLGPGAVRCVALHQGQILLFTETESVIYDSHARHLVWQDESDAQTLDVAVEPWYYAAQQQVYVGGQRAVWRLALAGESPRFFPIGQATLDGYQFAVSDDGEELFVTHGHGVIIVDSFTGRLKWDSADALGMRAPSDVFLPCLVGDALLFGRLNRQGRHDACFLPVKNRNDLVVAGSFNQILCSPTLGPGSLLLGVRQDEQIGVQALRL